MDYSEVWGIAANRIDKFFSAQSDVEKLSELHYKYRAADVLIEKLPDRQFSIVSLPRTQVTITGGEDADEIHRRFYMQFLSAGG